jgi:hypothetical protein
VTLGSPPQADGEGRGACTCRPPAVHVETSTNRMGRGACLGGRGVPRVLSLWLSTVRGID